MASNAERFLSLYEQRKKKKKETDTENMSARERFLSLYEERVAPKRVFDWFSKSNAILEEVNSQYKGNADERFYDPDKYDIDSLLDRAKSTRSYLDARKSDKDFDYETYSAAADRLTAALGDIKAGTYGQNRYEYDGKEYTRAQLEDMAEESKTKAKESKQWYHYIPLVGDLIGGFTDDYQSPDLGKTSNQEYKEAVKKGELVKGYIADIDKYKMRQYYEALREEPDFEEKSGYVSTKSTKPFSRLFSEYGLGYDDVGYEYINNINDARGRIARAARVFGADAAGVGRDPASPFEKKGYDYIEDDEVKTYNYLYQTKGKDEAEKYIDSLNLTERMTSDYKEKMSGFAKEHPILASIASVLAGGEGWKGYVKSAADYIAGNGIDENSYYSLGTNLSQSARDSVSQDMGGVGKFLYGTGMSMADFLYTTATSAGNSFLSIARLGGSAANSTIISAKERGLSDSQALALGTVAGAAEAITEKFSIDALLDATGMGKNAVQYLLKNILTEGSEEVGSSVINLVADTLISKDKSEWKLAMQGYIDNGDDEKTAFWKAMADQAGQIGLDFLGGALSGGVLAGGAVGLNAAVNSNTNVGREIASNPARLAEVMDMAQNFEPVTDAYQLAQQIAEEQQAGKEISARRAGQLARAVSKQYANNMSRKPAESPKKAPTSADTAQEGNITTEGQNAAQERTGKATRAVATIGGEKVVVRGIASVDNDTAYVELDNGGTADIDDVSFSNSQIERVYAAASNYEINGAKAVVAGFDGSVPAEVYIKSARQYYTAGLVGLPIENVAQDGYGKYIADLATRQSLYQAGMLDAQAKTAAEVEAREQAKKPDSRYGVRHEYTAELDDNQKQQIEILDVVGRLFNVSIVVKDEIAGGFSNGLYDSKNSVIEIALDDVSQAYLRIAGHELTHYIQNWSPEKYKLFRDFVVRALIEKHGQEAFNQLVQDTILQYGTQASQKLTKQQAIDEIVANSAEMFLNNADLINDIVNKDKSLAQKIIDFFKDFIAKLESAFKNITANSAEAKALSEDINTLKQAQKLWSDALRDAAAQVESKQAEKESIKKESAESDVDHEIIVDEAEAAGSDDYELIYSLKDSEGRELTPEQAEFFKDSKVRDENGNLLVVYHGTSERFTVFDRSKGRANMDIQGMFFSPWELDAKGYGDRVGAYYINIVNPANEGTAYKALNMFKGQNEAGIKAREYLESLGYDGVNNSNEEFIAFSPEQIKSTDNLKPTVDPDLRYQLKGVEWTDYKELYNNSEKNNKALEETIAALKDEFKIFDYRRPNMKHVRKLANKLLKEYSSDYNVDELTTNLAALFNYIANGEARSYDDVMTAAAAIAKNIIDKSSFKMDNGEGLDEFRKYVWSTPIKFTTIQKEEVKRLTGQNFMQWSMGKFKAVSDTNKKGIPLDSVWPELCEMSLGMLDPDTNEGDMPFALAEAMEKAADSSVDFTLEEMIDEGMHPLAECYGMTMGETLIYTANKIFDTYLSIPEVHTFAEKQQIKFDKMQEKYKEKIAALRDSFREEKAALKEKYKREYKEKIEKDKQKREERADVKKYKAQIQKMAKSLSDKLLNPKEKSYVPDNLRKAVADVLLLIDFETGRKAPDGGDTQVTLKLRKLKDAYEKIKKDEAHELHRFYNDDIEVALAELAEITEGKRINQLSYDELTDVMNIVKYFNHVISNENKMFNENLKEQRHELGENALSENRKAKPMKQMSAVKNNRVLSSFIELVRTGAMKPYYFFNRIGGTVQRLYNEMRKGEFKWVNHIEKSRAYAKEQMKRCNYQKWNTTEKSTFTTERGDKIQFTVGEKMYLYMLYRRPQGQKHVTVGGVVLDEAVKEVKGKFGITYEVKDTIPVQFTIDDMQKISESLTAEQREFAEVMGKYLADTCGSWGNEVTNKLFGFSVFTDPNYIPINSAKNYLFQKAGVSSDIRLKRKGFTKPTVPHANNPVVVSDFMRVWAQHVNDMAMYNSFVPQIEDFTQIWNYKQKAGTGGESVRALIERGYGKEANEYIKNLLNDLNGGVIRPRGEGLFSSFLSLMKKSAVFASLSVSIQQVSSLPRAFAVIEPRYFVNSDKLSYKELKKWAPIAVIKQWGYFDTHMGRSVTDLLIEPEYESKAEQVKALFKDRNRRDEAFAWLPQKMDEIAWSMIWNAAKRKTLDMNPNLKEGSDEHMKAAADLFTETIDKTQVVDSVFQRAEIMRSNSAALRTATLFMAEPLTYYNMLVDAGLDKNKGNRARIISSVVTAMVLNSALAAIVYAMRDDDEDKTYGEKYKAEFFEGLIDAPFSMLPYVKDAYSIIQGYSPKRPEMQLIDDLYNRLKKFSFDKPLSYVRVAEVLAAFKGIPLKNINRDIEAIFDTSVNALRNAGIIDDPKADPAKAFELAKEKYDIHKRDANGSLNAAVSSVFYDIAYAAKEKGDKATYDSVKRYLLNSGRKASDFENAMQNREIKKLKEDERITEAAQAEIDKDFHRRMEILKQFITEGHKKDTVIKAISQEVSRLHKENAPDAEEFIEAYKTGDRSKWYPLYTRLKLAGWSHNDIIALIK